MKIEKIYFDMDDTIADFSLGLTEICGLEPVSQDRSTKEQDDAMWEAIRRSGDFYYRLRECVPGMDLFRALLDKYGDKVEILTAVPKAKRGIVTAADDKIRWVREHICSDTVVNIALSASDKQLYAKGEGYILIDDLPKNIQSWKAAGGSGILFRKDDPQSVKREILEIGIL